MINLNLSSHTIGILGGIGPAAGAHFQQLLVAELNRAGLVEDRVFPRIIMLSIPLRDGWDNRGAGNKIIVAQQVRQGINWLESLGAKLIAVPCNSVHEFIDSSSVVNIIDATLACCLGTKVVGVLCSRQTRESRLYERNKEQQYVYIKDQDKIDNLIARVLTGERPEINFGIDELNAAGAGQVILGCTELSLCPRRYPGPTAVVDSAKVLATTVVYRLVTEMNLVR